MTGAEIVVRALRGRGVEVTFGMPGSQVLELFDALVDSPVRNVLVTSEQSAVFMADGYARATGRAGVCLAVPGPGLTNMVSGLAEALTDSSPVVVVVGGVEQGEKAFRLHGIEQLEAVRPVVKKVISVDGVEGIRAGIDEAFDLAESGEPGPVVVEVEHRLFRERAEESGGGGPARRRESGAATAKDGATIKRIADTIRRAGRIGFYAGKGAVGAAEEIRELSELLCAPVATTISGKGVLPEDHELAVGFGFGPTGSQVAQEVFEKCELVLAIGCKFGEMSTSKWMMEVKGTLLHVDASAEVLNRNYPAAETLCMDASDAVRAIAGELKGAGRARDGALLERIAKAKEAERERARRATAEGGIHPSRLLRELRESMDSEVVVATDCGSHQLWAIQDFPVLAPGAFITPSDYQAMGFGVPAAIGACVGGKRAVCLTGDGGLLMSGFELLTAVREQLALAVVVFNDGSLGLIKDMQEKLYGRTDSVDFVSPRYRELSAALGVEYIGIEEAGELRDGLRRMARAPGPVLVDVRISHQGWPRFIDQMAKATWWRLPISEKARTLGKRAGRLLKYGR